MYKDQVFSGPAVQLLQMLDAREKRVKLQKELLTKFPQKTVLSFCLNIPGPIKTSTVLLEMFEELEQEIIRVCIDIPCLEKMKILSETGFELLLVFDCPALELKQFMVTIEENHPYGRLADLDVVIMEDQELKSISRSVLNAPKRKCLICESDAKVCGRSRTHTVEELQVQIASIIFNRKERKHD